MRGHQVAPQVLPRPHLAGDEVERVLARVAAPVRPRDEPRRRHDGEQHEDQRSVAGARASGEAAHVAQRPVERQRRSRPASTAGRRAAPRARARAGRRRCAKPGCRNARSPGARSKRLPISRWCDASRIQAKYWSWSAASSPSAPDSGRPLVSRAARTRNERPVSTTSAPSSTRSSAEGRRPPVAAGGAVAEAHCSLSDAPPRCVRRRASRRQAARGSVGAEGLAWRSVHIGRWWRGGSGARGLRVGARLAPVRQKSSSGRTTRSQRSSSAARRDVGARGLAVGQQLRAGGGERLVVARRHRAAQAGGRHEVAEHVARARHDRQAGPQVVGDPGAVGEARLEVRRVRGDAEVGLQQPRARAARTAPSRR